MENTYDKTDPLYTEEDIRAHLKARCFACTYKSVAADLGLSKSYINDVANCRRSVSSELAAKLGYVQDAARYRYVGQSPAST